jgi:hypothetical protein
MKASVLDALAFLFDIENVSAMTLDTLFEEVRCTLF